MGTMAYPGGMGVMVGLGTTTLVIGAKVVVTGTRLAVMSPTRQALAVRGHSVKV